MSDQTKSDKTIIPNGLQTLHGQPVDRSAAREIPVPPTDTSTKVVKLKSGVTVTWGIPTAQQHASLGVVQSVRRNPNGKEKTYPDENGDTAAVIYYDAGMALTVEILCASSATIPDRGDVLSHDSVSYLIENVEQNWQSEDCQKMTLTLKKWDNVALA